MGLGIKFDLDTVMLRGKGSKFKDDDSALLVCLTY